MLSLSQPSVFEMLVDRYQDDFFRTALKIVHHKEEAEDIIQESFTKIYLNAKKFREVEGASFKSWAYKIVINTAFTHYKKLKRSRESIKYVDQSFYEGFAEVGRNIETEADIQILVSRNLSKMPLHLQAVLKKYYLEDKSQKSIAEEEKVSVTTIKMRLFRAKKVLRKILDGETCLIK